MYEAIRPREMRMMIAGARPRPATAAGRERIPREMVSATIRRPHCLRSSI